MPYTLSHAAAALPFSRPLARLGILSATVVGTMVPDFGYLLPVHPDRTVTHSASSLLTFSLPLGLMTYWIFQLLMKRPLVALMPDHAYRRWQVFEAPAAWNSPRQWVLASVGVLLGAVTHLVWDGFAHEGARGMRMLPELDDWMVELHGHQLVGPQLIETVSSVLGLAIVLAALVFTLWGRDADAQSHRELSASERRNWLMALALVTLLGVVGFDALDHLHRAYDSSRIEQINDIAIATLRGLAFSTLAVSVCLGVYLRAKRKRQDRAS